jgi:hypothetical protein
VHRDIPVAVFHPGIGASLAVLHLERAGGRLPPAAAACSSRPAELVQSPPV